MGNEDTQLQLRSVVEKLRDGRFNDISADELAEAERTRDRLAGMPNLPPQSGKLLSFLHSHLEDYEQALGKGAVDEDPQYPNVATDAEFFTSRPRRPVGALAGIEVNLRSRTYEVKGGFHLKGDIPDDALVIVRDGSVRIDGFVFGGILAPGDITVKENVQGGYVISSHGDIRVRRALSNSRIISQTGSVICQGAENPECIYARYELQVTDSVRGGLLIGQHIKGKGVFAPREARLTGSCDAPQIGGKGVAQTVICLRRRIPCEEYGCRTTERAAKLQAELTRAWYRYSQIENTIDYARKDAINCLRSMLYMMHATKPDRQRLALLRAAQTEAIFFEALQDTGRDMRSQLETAYRAVAEVQPEEIEAIATETERALRAIEEALNSLKEDFAARCRQAVLPRIREFAGLLRTARGDSSRTINVPKLLSALDDLDDNCDVALSKSRDQAELLVYEFGINPQVARRIEAEPAALPRMLSETLSAARARPGSEAAERADSTLMRIMQRSVERQTATMENQNTRLEAVGKDLDEAKSKLAWEPSVIMAQDVPWVRAEHFAAGVVVTALPTAADLSDASSHDMVELHEALHGFVTFQRVHDRIVRDDATDL